MKWALASVAVVAIAGAAPAETFGGLRGTYNNYRIDRIKHVVVIYAENRSFDNLYGRFPGVDGLGNANATSSFRIQKDRDGSVLKVLPPVWGGLTAAGVVPVITQAQTENMANQPFALDASKGYNASIGVTTRDLWHRFYQNQMQIDNGANDKFAAWADSGGLVMGNYSATLPLWSYAKRYTLADHFFMAAFGGSFLNHQYLICSCAPYYPNADKSVAKGTIAVVNRRWRQPYGVPKPRRPPP